MDEQDEDALFDRLAKSLQAVRQDAELARSVGAEGISAGLARAEAEQRSLAAAIESLRHRFEQQQAVTARLEATAVKSAADLQELRLTVEALSRRMPDRAEVPAAPPAAACAAPPAAACAAAPAAARAAAPAVAPAVPQAAPSAVPPAAPPAAPQTPLRTAPPVRRPPSRAAARVAMALAVVVVGGAAVWVASRENPAVGALTHRFVVWLSEVTGIDLAALGEPPQSVSPVAQVSPSPEPALQPQSPLLPPASAAPAPAPAPVGVAVAVETPAAAPPQVAPPSPPTAATGNAAAPTRVELPATTAPPPAAEAVGEVPPVQAAIADAPPPAAAVPPVQPATAEAPSPVTAAPPDRSSAAAVATLRSQADAGAAPPSAEITAAATPGPPWTSAWAAAHPIAPFETQAPVATATIQPSRPSLTIHRFVLKATADTWIQVRETSGNYLLRKILKAGDTWTVPAEPDLILDTGNAEGLDLVVDGVDTRLAGAKGGVIHGVSLDGDLLGSGVAVRMAH